MKKRRRLHLNGTRALFQAHPRMRVPSQSHPFMHQLHVVDAICRSSKIDTEDLYGDALREVRQEQNAGVFADLSSLVTGTLSGEPGDKVFEAAHQLLSGMDRFHDDDEAYASILEFNRRFLNNNGHVALFMSLILEAAALNPAEMDAHRGGEALVAAYGQRRTQGHKRLGSQLQRRVKRLPSIDEPGFIEAADRYVRYRYLDNGSLPAYTKRQELEGNVRSGSYLRKWFEKFDKAFGFPPPPRGRPRKRRSGC